MQIFKQKLLTNFNSERWKGVDMRSVECCIKELNSRIDKVGVLYGELYSDEVSENISLTKAAITIRNISDICSISTPSGKIAEEILKNVPSIKFDIKGSGNDSNGEIIFKKIYTWNLSNLSKQEERELKLEKILN